MCFLGCDRCNVSNLRRTSGSLKLKGYCTTLATSVSQRIREGRERGEIKFLFRSLLPYHWRGSYHLSLLSNQSDLTRYYIVLPQSKYNFSHIRWKRASSVEICFFFIRRSNGFVEFFEKSIENLETYRTLDYRLKACTRNHILSFAILFDRLFHYSFEDLLDKHLHLLRFKQHGFYFAIVHVTLIYFRQNDFSIGIYIFLRRDA